MSARRRAFGGCGEGGSFGGQVHCSVRTIVLWALLVSSVPTFQPDLAGQSTEQGGAAYVLRSRLRSRLREVLTIFGDRLERPGKERLALVGTLKLPSQRAALPFKAVWELPERLRIETPMGVLTVNGQILTGVATRTDEALVETFLYDTAEHFFLGQSQGLGTRFLGSRFRLDDGTTADYRDPYYDVYEVNDAVGLGTRVRMQPKLYYLNSDTLLLEWSVYQSNRDSSETKVAVQFGNWERGDRQSVPGRIIRLENGQAVFTVTVISAVIGPRQNDGLFGAP